MKKAKKYLYPIVFTVALLSLTLYVLLDVFVIPQEYEDFEKSDRVAQFLEAEASKTDASESSPETELKDETGIEDETLPPSETEAPEPEYPVITDTSYVDKYIKIEIVTKRILNANVYIADIELASPVFLQTAFAYGKYGRNVKAATSDIAESVNAILAINGDFYGARDVGFVVREGKVYRDAPEKGKTALIITEDGKFDFAEESNSNVYDLVENGAYDVFTFGPALVKDGRLMTSNERGQTSKDNPRTAIGYISENHYVFVVVDGRTEDSEGLSVNELAEVMKGLGCVDAYNLDGGGSSTLYFNGKVINTPTYHGDVVAERSVSDIVYIGY